jgi:hypothetical protein
MSSFNVVNFSLRPNKAIQRSLVFEALRLLQRDLNLENLLYVGMGSIWFADFQQAHKALHIDDMISIEADEIGFKRAKFNQPYKTVRVQSGYTYEVLPSLLSDSRLSTRPWLIWLDYTVSLNESVVGDIRRIVEGAPPNSILLTTFSASGRALGKPAHRPARLRALLGSVVPDDLATDACTDERLWDTLLDLTANFMVSVAASAARPGGFIPAFRLAYRDTTPMATVGGVLPSKGAVPAMKAVVSSAAWPAIAKEPITAPLLTLKEAAVLQAQLPRTKALDREVIQKLGFDLHDDQVRSFERYYRYYPIYAQIAT